MKQVKRMVHLFARADSPQGGATLHLPLALLVGIAALIFVVGAFPALYGDEYDSLFDALHLTGNVHAIGYFAQLRLWLQLSGSDAWLRLLSLVWAGVALVCQSRWLEAEGLPPSVCRLAGALLAINPFFWQYAFQIRFYSFLLAASLLVFWRTALYHRSSSRRNLFWLLLSFALVVTSHLFGWMVVGLSFLYLLARRRPCLAAAAAIAGASVAVVLMLWPSGQHRAIALVYRFTNPYAVVPETGLRGLSPAMAAKLPLTFFFFTMGERVYPLTIWLVAPALALVGLCSLRGLRKTAAYPGLATWCLLGMLATAAVFLVLDPMAPPSLQGAAPRYVIFVLPVFLALLALGASDSRGLMFGLAAIQVVALAFFLFPTWSYGQGDIIDWRRAFSEAVAVPSKTCLVVDGRASGPAERYAPPGVHISRQLDGCLGHERLVLVTGDFRLRQVRSFDAMAARLAADYDVVDAMSRFPAQITVYDLRPGGLAQLPPGRLDLPEQDLRLPLTTREGWTLNGFVRLDSETPVYEGPIEVSEPAVVLSNFRSSTHVPAGTPVLSVTLLGAAGEQQSTILHAGRETAAWDGTCSACRPVASWTKRLHLVGAQGYPGAYRHHEAFIWAAPIPMPQWPVHSLRAETLLPRATVYLWGLYPQSASGGLARSGALEGRD